MQCNIDQRGRKARLTSGMIASGVGLGLLIFGIAQDNNLLLIIGIVLLITGLFMIFEGLKGWCALRALGVKTPL